MRKFLTLIILAIFIIPLSSVIPLRGQPIWYGQYLGLLFFLFLSVSVVLWQFNRWLSVFTLLCLYSTFFVTSMSPRSIVLLFQLDLACLASYGISRFGKKHRQIIIKAIVGLMLLQGLWIALQANNIPIKIKTDTFETDLTFVSRLRPGQKEMVGFSGSPDQIGAFFALTLPIALYVFPPLVLLSLAGLVVSKSSFAFVAAILSGLIYFFYTNKKVFKMVVWQENMYILERSSKDELLQFFATWQDYFLQMDKILERPIDEDETLLRSDYYDGTDI